MFSSQPKYEFKLERGHVGDHYSEPSWHLVYLNGAGKIAPWFKTLNVNDKDPKITLNSFPQSLVGQVWKKTGDKEAYVSAHMSVAISGHGLPRSKKTFNHHQNQPEWRKFQQMTMTIIKEDGTSGTPEKYKKQVVISIQKKSIQKNTHQLVCPNLVLIRAG